MKPSFLGRLLSASALAVATLASLPAQAGSFSGLFVFGDSLSDNGNNALAGLYDPAQVITGNTYIPSYTYAPAHVYSNGPVWATYFAAMIGVPLAPSLAGGGDFAFGGATTGTPGSGTGGFPYSLRVQADQYLGTHGGVASPDALYVVAGGGDNVRAALAAIAGGANVGATAVAFAAAFAADVGDIVDQLQDKGAQHILVWNAPNAGIGPAIVAGGGAALGSFLATAMNGALDARLAGEPGVTTFDLFGFSSMIAAHPAAFGLTNVTDACGAIIAANCSQYLFWDGIHPTTAGHRAIANAVALTLQVPEPQTYALLAFGLVAVALQTRRRVVNKPAVVG